METHGYCLFACLVDEEARPSGGQAICWLQVASGWLRSPVRGEGWCVGSMSDLLSKELANTVTLRMVLTLLTAELTIRLRMLRMLLTSWTTLRVTVRMAELSGRLPG